MFYSHFLLSRKGPLGAIWLAACCFKRLKKHQVADTDIGSSVDKILVDEMPSVTYRILAYLLLGVVRIYSKKVEYLFHDCHVIINDMNKVFGKRIVSFRKATGVPEFSITLPEKYELDAFKFDVPDDASGGNVAEREDIVLPEAWKTDGFGKCSLDKETHSTAQPLAESVVQQEISSSTKAPNEPALNQETCSTAHTPPSKVLSPHLMEIDMEATSPYSKRNSEASMEIIREIRFAREECLDFEMFCQKEARDPGFFTSTVGATNTDLENVDFIEEMSSANHAHVTAEASTEMLQEIRFSEEECLDFEMFCQAEIGALCFETSSGGVQTNNVEHGDFIEKTFSENHELVAAEGKEVASTSQRTPGFIFQDTRGSGTSEFLAVCTPANKESMKRPAKRKCKHDDIIVLPNEVLKQNIDDASGLICKRRKVPHTILDLWRFSRIPNVAQVFLEPLIPCMALELMDFVQKKEPKTVKATEIAQAPGKPQVVISPRTPPDSRSAIAPGTPLLPRSNRAYGGRELVDSDAEGTAHSFKNVMNEYAAHEEGLYLTLMNEETDQNKSESEEPDHWTARSRTVAWYLHKGFFNQNRKKAKSKEAVSLSHILRGKTKEESARLFYEILVLKSGGHLDVIQENPYGDILVRETNKMGSMLGDC
ncbi:hypothetical protein Ancab_002675 [Ancistrocladus abbreviatus]